MHILSVRGRKKKVTVIAFLFLAGYMAAPGCRSVSCSGMFYRRFWELNRQPFGWDH